MLAGDCPGWHEILVPPGTFCPGSTTGMGGIWCHCQRLPIRGGTTVFGWIFEFEIIIIDRMSPLS
jgi:hypothetical protein